MEEMVLEEMVFRVLRSALKELQKSCPAESSDQMELLVFDSPFDDE